jgi:hypothetical protein
MDWTNRLSEISKNSRLARALWLTTAVLVSWLHLFVHTLGIKYSDLPLDDAGTWGVARRSLGTLLTLPTEFNSQPQLFYFFLHYLINISTSPWFLRGISWFFCWVLIMFVLFYWHELSLFSRLAFCLLFIFGDITHYLATAVRPYGMGSWLTLVSTVMLLRLLREPSLRRAIIYAIWTTAMLYTMAFEVAVFLVHGLFVVGTLVATLVRHGRAQALSRGKVWLPTLVAVSLAYLPFLILAIHYQYRSNPTDTLAKVLTLSTYTVTIENHFRFSQEAMLGLLVLSSLGLVGELGRRNWLVLLWPLTIVGSIAFVWYFIVGRSVIGAQGKYMMPAYLAVCALAAMGFQQFRPLVRRRFWPALVVMLALLVGSKFEAFHAYMKAEPEIGPFTVLHRQMLSQPGKKVIFFDIGYDGQHVEYVARHDPNVIFATMRGRGWASGGDNHLTDEYVTNTIEASREECRCFFYYIENPRGPFARAFVPTLERRGFKRIPSMTRIWNHEVVGYCRD